MKKLLMGLAVLLAAAALSPSLLAQATAGQAQRLAPDCDFGFIYKVVAGVITSTTPLSNNRLPLSSGGGGVVGYDNRPTGCVTWTVMYWTTGVSALSLELDQAPNTADNPGTWVSWATPAPGTAFPLTNVCTGTASCQATAFNWQPWVSINLNSATGTGTVWGRTIGWRPQAGQDVTQPGNSTIVVGYNFTPITTSTNTSIKTSPGTLHLVVINQPGATANSVTIVDTSAANCSGGTTIATWPTGQLPASLSPTSVGFDVIFSNGLCVTTAGTTPPNLTVSWR